MSRTTCRKRRRAKLCIRTTPKRTSNDSRPPSPPPVLPPRLLHRPPTGLRRCILRRASTMSQHSTGSCRRRNERSRCLSVWSTIRNSRSSRTNLSTPKWFQKSTDLEPRLQKRDSWTRLYYRILRRGRSGKWAGMGSGRILFRYLNLIWQ